MQTEHVKIIGMTCGGCTAKVSKALKGIYGVKDVQVSLADSAATVQFDEQLASSAQIRLAVKGAGYGLEADPTPQSQRSKGGCCA